MAGERTDRRRSHGLVALLLCFGAGLAAAGAVGGCGGDGSVAEQISTGGSVSVTRTFATQTREAPIAPTTAPTPPTTAPTEPEEAPPRVTVTETLPAETTPTETRPALTITPTETLEVTVTEPAEPAPETTAAAPVEEDDTDTWVWAVLAAASVLLIALFIWLLRRGGHKEALARRERVLAAAVAGWTAQGWAIESQTATTTILRRDGERVAVTVDPDERVTTAYLAD